MSAGYRLFSLAGALAGPRVRRRAAGFSPAAIRRIWVHKPDHLGDALLARPALAALRAAYPQAEIVFACHPPAAALLAADVLGYRLEPWDSPFLGGGGSWLKYRAAVRRRSPDLLINLRHDVRDILLCTACRPRFLATYDHEGTGRLATHPGRPPEEAKPEADNHLSLLAETLRIAPATVPPLPLTPAAQTAAAVWDSLPGDGPRIVLHAAARTPAKLWPAAHWRALLGLLAERTRARLAFIGGGDDRPFNQIILHGQNGRAADWAGRFDLAQTAGIVAAADLLIGVDSGPGHLAKAVGTPVVTLMSGTNVAPRWAPDPARALAHPVACAPCRKERCPVAGHPCLRDLTPAEVLGAVERWWRT
ncbi:MAG: glycosyltransferase family 9 protein [Myxococcales bacterium]|nr:glycosyltransferase family 9 protein [Myxococcales bacterium]